MAEREQIVMDREKDAHRTEVYGRLERDHPRRWEDLRGCTVKHVVFGEGTISKVMMPDWSNPVHLAVRFAQRERVFHLSAVGDHTKFPENDFPEALAALIAQAEHEIAEEQRRLEEDRRRKESEAQEAVARRQEQEAARLAALRQAQATEENALRAQAETRLSEICDKVARDEAITDEEIRLLLRSHRHEPLLGYYERLFARTGEYRTIVKAGTTWRTARHPDFALRVTDLLLEGIERLPESARCGVFTLRGEAYLDLHKFAEAKESALSAVACAGKRPQPYQLLGMIEIACGESTAGELHFAKARELAGVHGAGRLEKAQQAEIKRQIQSHAQEPATQKAFANDLLRIDPRRYNWLEAYI